MAGSALSVRAAVVHYRKVPLCPAGAGFVHHLADHSAHATAMARQVHRQHPEVQLANNFDYSVFGIGRPGKSVAYCFRYILRPTRR